MKVTATDGVGNVRAFSAAIVRRALASPAVPEHMLGAHQLRLLTHYVLGYLNRRQTNALLHLGGSLLRLEKPATSRL